MSGSERRRELRRRRHRKKKVTKLLDRSGKASAADRLSIADKLRHLTPGAEELIKRHQLLG